MAKKYFCTIIVLTGSTVVIKAMTLFYLLFRFSDRVLKSLTKEIYSHQWKCPSLMKILAVSQTYLLTFSAFWPLASQQDSIAFCIFFYQSVWYLERISYHLFLNLYIKAKSMSVCLCTFILPYLKTKFESKGTKELPMTLGYLEKQKFSLPECLVQTKTIPPECLFPP